MIQPHSNKNSFWFSLLRRGT